MTDTYLDLEDYLERPVVTRVPPRRTPPPAAPCTAVRYPAEPVPDLQDAVPVMAEARSHWSALVRRVTSWRPRRVALADVSSSDAAVLVRLPGRPWPRSRVLAGLLGVFLGGLGLHALYLGHRRRGLWMLGTTLVLGPLTLGVAALVMGVWGFTEGLLVLGSRRGRFARDAWGRQLRG
ncbi:NINE protein [Cellulomonas xiejunii]|uniref:NINE protein n=1 Tax=Cellulomonas xiejunii TaxID=2968083 RepID=UPI001D0DD3A6|nr:NINE protein [Cellulomonas xiejunii]MCC2313457.1 NINE protein [Cellulomonas xiejunii]